MDPSSRLHKHIAIVTALDDLSTSPSILNAVHLLVEAGYQVDIIARGNHCSMPNDEGWKYGVYFHLSPWSVRKGIPGLVALRHLLNYKNTLDASSHCRHRHPARMDWFWLDP